MNLDLQVATISQLTLVALLHFAWQATVIGLLLMLAKLLIPSRHFQLRYIASVFGLFAFIACPLATLGYYGLSDSTLFASSPDGGLATPVELASGTSILSQLEIQFASIFFWFDSQRALWLGLWLIGFALLVIRLGWSLSYCVQIRQSRIPLPPHLQKLADNLKAKIKISRRVVVASSHKVSQAVATGIIKPVVLVPASWLSELPIPAIEAILAHELSHVKRWDLWINMLQRVTETLFFFHPFTWWLSRWISTEREICCDQLAIRTTGKKVQYVETLAQIANTANNGFNFQFGTAFNGDKNMKLLRRAKMILEPTAIDRGSPSRGLTMLTCVGLLVSLGSFAYCGFPEPMTSPQQEESLQKTQHQAEYQEVEPSEEIELLRILQNRIQSNEQLDNRTIAQQLRDLADQLDSPSHSPPKEEYSPQSLSTERHHQLELPNDHPAKLHGGDKPNVEYLLNRRLQYLGQVDDAIVRVKPELQDETIKLKLSVEETDKMRARNLARRAQLELAMLSVQAGTKLKKKREIEQTLENLNYLDLEKLHAQAQQLLAERNQPQDAEYQRSLYQYKMQLDDLNHLSQSVEKEREESSNAHDGVAEDLEDLRNELKSLQRELDLLKSDRKPNSKKRVRLQSPPNQTSDEPRVIIEFMEGKIHENTSLPFLVPYAGRLFTNVGLNPK